MTEPKSYNEWLEEQDFDSREFTQEERDNFLAKLGQAESEVENETSR